jgi:polysaccharide export outer membrane protein
MQSLVKQVASAVTALALLLSTAAAQQPALPADTTSAKPAAAEPRPLEQRPSPSYQLGTGDTVLIRAAHAEEISEKPFPIDADGNLNLPLVGKVKASGLTVDQLENTLRELLKVYIKNPEVLVALLQYHSEPVYLVGAFRAPGTYQLQGRRTLTELLSSVGGLQPNARRKIKLTRRLEQRKIPLATAVEDPEAKTSSVEITLSTGAELVRAEENLVLQPFDVLKATLSEFVYITGEVGKTGAFELNDRSSLSVTQVLSMAGGLSPNAAAQRAHILRPVLDTAKRAQIPVNIQSIMAGQSNDFPLLPNDVLVVPRSAGKHAVLNRTMLMIGPPIVTSLIYVFIRR